MPAVFVMAIILFGSSTISCLLSGRLSVVSVSIFALETDTKKRRQANKYKRKIRK